MASYTVFDHGRIESGNAEFMVEAIRHRGGRDDYEIRRMPTADYAKAVIEDAPYILEVNLLDAMKKLVHDSDFDRALACLAQMPTSGIHIPSSDFLRKMTS